MNTYKTSSGERIKKSVIDRLVRSAKSQVLVNQINEHDYNFCEECKQSSGTYLDCSHTISVDQCQKQGKSELAWDISNLRVLCRNCHKKHDKL
jgi:5-methylcytosine-specific restriction endonuclease McrA